MVYFVDSLKCDSIRLKKIGNKDILDRMFTSWLLNSHCLEYDSFWMMFINNEKATNQAKKKKTKVEFDFILEQILNLDTKNKASKLWSIKSIFKPRKRKKSYRKSLNLFLYFSKPSHLKEKCYYKYPKYDNKDFWLKFQTRIKEFWFKANAT